jgi:hypothetical protein
MLLFDVLLIANHFRISLLAVGTAHSHASQVFLMLLQLG